MRFATRSDWFGWVKNGTITVLRISIRRWMACCVFFGVGNHDHVGCGDLGVFE